MKELVSRLRDKAITFDLLGFLDTSEAFSEAADAIEALVHQRDAAFNRLCDWCGVCPKGKRDVLNCDDIARL